MSLDTITKRLEEIAGQDEHSPLTATFLKKVSLSDPGAHDSHVYMHLVVDANNKIREKDFVRHLLLYVTNYAIPRSLIREAKEKDAISGFDANMSKLREQAKELFVSMEQTGELGELLLWALAEMYLGYPQAICKMPLKTDEKLHYNGIDGVHLWHDAGNLEVFWGEAKMHSSFYQAAKECIDGLSEFVNAGEGVDLELGILNTKSDVGCDEVNQALRKYFDRDDPAHNNLKYSGIGFIGFDEYNRQTFYDEPYANETIAEAIQKQHPNLSRLINSYIKSANLQNANIHLFCIPFRNVQSLRDAFLAELKGNN